jgi:hypothetical protein
MQTENLQLISSLYAVNDALRDCGQERLFNYYQEDMVRWAFEAERKINSWKSFFEQKSICLLLGNNKKWVLPNNYWAFICATIGGSQVNLVNKATCRCSPLYKAGGIINIKIQGQYIYPLADIDTGTQLVLEYESIMVDDNDGFPMIFEAHTSAINYYIQYKVFSLLAAREPNNTGLLNQKREADTSWVRECADARARTNKLSPEQWQIAGRLWYRYYR